jgi:small subunit ribosomal protein S8
MTDPIADMLTRLRNAVSARHTRVDIPTSRMKVEIARILQDEGYIQSYKVVVVEEETGKTVDGRTPARRGLRQVLRIALKYGPRGENVISGIERISRPGRRVYFGRHDVPPVLAGLGTSILTTSRGVMTGREAVKAGVGGEVLCNVW